MVEQVGKDEFVYTRTKMLNIRPKAVHVPISIPLRQIIEKHRKERRSGRLFENLISDQKVNLNIKLIAEKAGVTKSISAKTGRHTFATIFLRATKDLNTLKEIMGHSNISQTLVYAHVLNQDKLEGIKVFDSFAT